MSAADHHAHPNPHAGEHHDDHEGSHGSLRDYLIGFILSAVLTAIPFWLVMSGAIADKQATGSKSPKCP